MVPASVLRYGSASHGQWQINKIRNAIGNQEYFS
jgi:hypothetical protein